MNSFPRHFPAPLPIARRPAGPRTNRRRTFDVGAAFTLVELLVVIACLGILVSLILPTVKGALSTARAVACSSNLRQIAAAGAGYSADNDQRIFPVYINTEDQNWTVLLSSYLGTQATNTTVKGANKIFVCPERKDKYGFGYNYINLSWIAPSTGANQWIKYAQVAHPSQTVLLVDNYVPQDPVTKWRPFVRAPNLNMSDVVVEYRHPNKTANVLWVDGHVTRESSTNSITNSAVWDIN